MARHASQLDSLLVSSSFDGDVYKNEPMARHTSYRIGGPARYFVQANSIGSISHIAEACDDSGIEWVVVGRGSNLLVSDEGFPGVVVTLGRDFRGVRFDEQSNRYSVGAGTMLSSLVQDAFHRSLAGLEFGVGTPGTVGGALRMNAGTSTTWLGQIVEDVTVLRPGEGLRRMSADDIEWGYRSTSFSPDEVICECELSVSPADPFYIRGKMEASLTRRRKTQPLDKPSCGSVFKNPEGQSAGDLIEQAGCKGMQLGGAQVSPVHANFIVNAHDASANDVRELIRHVQDKVRDVHGVQLETEVKFLGF